MSSIIICPHCSREFELLTDTGYCPHCGRHFNPKSNRTLWIVLAVLGVVVMVPILLFGACVLFLSAHP